jgi:hypothetical protein
MKRFKVLLIMAFLVGLVSIAYAGFDDGRAAYDRGDYATAYKEFKELADHGNAPGQCYLGMMYEMGHHVPKDYALAMDWYLKAAAQGDALAKVNLGWLYIRGDGVPQDYVLAHMWLNLAASQGYTPAQRYRNDLAEKMTPAQIAEAQRLAREWKPKGRD